MLPPSLDLRTVNLLWCSVLAETLVRLGLRQVVVSPGSRSTPLTFAFARHPALETVPVVDERSAGFFALGLAKAGGRPVVLVCTSGTAAANYFPAVIEASESGVPLLVLTADRPPEMRGCNSGQTIDQQKLYGGYVRLYHEMAPPENSEERLRYARQMLLHAWERATGTDPGPVHLNLPFRDPLAPVRDGVPVTAPPALLAADFFGHLRPQPVPPPVGTTFWIRPATARGLIVAGAAAAAEPSAYAAAAVRLAEETGWPLLADALSPVRTHAAADAGVVTTYDALVRNEELARDLVPRQVLCLGGWPTSKLLRSWLERSGAEVLVVAARPDNRDPLHLRTRQIQAEVGQLAVAGTPPADPAYRTRWREADRRARRVFDSALAAPEAEAFEGAYVRTLAEALPPGTPLFVAASMPVRDVEFLWPASRCGIRIFVNRGANGIDGTLSTALGVAHRRPPAVLLAGDLAFLHDSNGLLVARELAGSLTVVLINNAGGGIFEHLPVAHYDPPFERYFATPQQVNFARLAEAHGCAHVRVHTPRELAERLRPAPPEGLRILEVVTDRRRDAAFRKHLFALAAREAAGTG